MSITVEYLPSINDSRDGGSSGSVETTYRHEGHDVGKGAARAEQAVRRAWACVVAQLFTCMPCRQGGGRHDVSLMGTCYTLYFTLLY